MWDWAQIPTTKNPNIAVEVFVVWAVLLMVLVKQPKTLNKLIYKVINMCLYLNIRL